MSYQCASEISENADCGKVIRYSGKDCDLSDSEAGYYCGTSLEIVNGNLYKFRDDSIRPRKFLGTDDEDGINAILLDHEGHSLHEIINGDEPLRPIIDFDLPIETLNAISSKLSDKQAKNTLCNAFSDVCLEIFPKWDKKTISIADSSDVKKISLHVSTFGMRLPNITGQMKKNRLKIV